MEGSLRDDAPPGLQLIETLLWQPATGFARLPAHLARLRASAATLRIAFDDAAVEPLLASVAGDGPQRVRLTLALDGTPALTSAPLAPTAPAWTLRLAGGLRSSDPWLRLKTTRRPVHDAERAALPPGIDEALLLNERGEICEGTITNVFADLGEGLLTPPLACGVLPGVLRAELVAAGTAREAVLRPGDLAHARVLVGNALRGLIPARLAGRG
ncbi:MAG: aminotransferase class IV family protein [Amaricoccus sp.]|uniref:aminotransferase class IV family protein n=1 Tax=Amaricoccus sp. TaxID=1872485 RepID=UPI0039E37545